MHSYDRARSHVGAASRVPSTLAIAHSERRVELRPRLANASHLMLAANVSLEAALDVHTQALVRLGRARDQLLLAEAQLAQSRGLLNLSVAALREGQRGLNATREVMEGWAAREEKVLGALTVNSTESVVVAERATRTMHVAEIDTSAFPVGVRGCARASISFV